MILPQGVLVSSKIPCPSSSSACLPRFSQFLGSFQSVVEDDISKGPYASVGNSCLPSTFSVM
jgi:hypothetical protein